jgi:hypothetical protein
VAEEPPPACLGSSLRARRNNWMPRSAMLASNQDPQVLALVGEHPPIEIRSSALWVFSVALWACPRRRFFTSKALSWTHSLERVLARVCVSRLFGLSCPGRGVS